MKTILVTGATGAQGGSVAAHLLRAGKFAVRALTRKPESDEARSLARAGAQVVHGDLADPASLHAACRDCYAVFGVTNYLEHGETETGHGKNLADAAKAAGIEHFIYSTMPSSKKLTGGAIVLPHFETKVAIEQHIRSLGLRASFVNVAFYYENFIHFFPPRPQPDGSLAFSFPIGDTPLAAVAVEDLGGIVAAMFDRPAEFAGKTIGVAGDEMPAAKYAEIMGRVTSRKIAFQHIPREQFAAFGFPHAQEIADMFEVFRTYVGSRQADIAQCRSLYPPVQTFETWMRAHRQHFA